MLQGMLWCTLLVLENLEIFFMKAELCKVLLTCAYTKRKFAHPDKKGEWISSIHYFWARDKECGDENVWRRTKGGNTTDQIYFGVTLPSGEGETFNDVLEQQLKFFFSINTIRNGSESIGRAALTRVPSLSRVVVVV